MVIIHFHVLYSMTVQITCRVPDVFYYEICAYPSNDNFSFQILNPSAYVLHNHIPTSDTNDVVTSSLTFNLSETAGPSAEKLISSKTDSSDNLPHVILPEIPRKMHKSYSHEHKKSKRYHQKGRTHTRGDAEEARNSWKIRRRKRALNETAPETQNQSQNIAVATYPKGSYKNCLHPEYLVYTWVLSLIALATTLKLYFLIKTLLAALMVAVYALFILVFYPQVFANAHIHEP